MGNANRGCTNLPVFNFCIMKCAVVQGINHSKFAQIIRYRRGDLE